MKKLLEDYLSLRHGIWQNDAPPSLASPSQSEIRLAGNEFPSGVLQFVEFIFTVGQQNPEPGYVWFPPFELNSWSHVSSSGNGMIEFWRNIQQLETGYVDSAPLDAIKTDRSWRANWLLLGQYDSDELILDLDPGPKGIAGQVLLQQMHTISVLANSIKHLFQWLVHSIERNRDLLAGTDSFVPSKLPGYWDRPLGVAG